MAGEPRAYLTERDREVVREVSRFGAMTREQVVRLGLFGSKTRANERLRKLVQAGLLSARAQPLAAGGPRSVYMPGKRLPLLERGRRRHAAASPLFLQHQLGIVDIRIAFERESSVRLWLTDREIASKPLGPVPDAYVECDLEGLRACCFLEYDRGTETLSRIERKARAYLDLAASGSFERAFGRRFFRVLMVADSERRLASLSAAFARVTDGIGRLTTLPLLVAQGPARAIWRRPGGKAFEALTGA